MEYDYPVKMLTECCNCCFGLHRCKLDSHYLPLPFCCIEYINILRAYTIKSTVVYVCVRVYIYIYYIKHFIEMTVIV